jgi:type I site-specific restriction-modification system R (restriction) subunit
MIKITYPTYNFRFKEEANKAFIFDEVRKQWIWLSPEEWVRQNFLQYLIQVKKYPASLLSVEKEIKSGELKKRYDIVVYKNGEPWMIVECKEMEVALNDAVITQVLRYNAYLDVDFLVVTNGSATHAFETATQKWLTDFPDYHNV